MVQVKPELIRIAARQVRLWRGGDGPPLFFLHGGYGDAFWHWRTVWDMLADSYSVAAPDLPRFGGTVELPNASLAALVEWVAQVQELAAMPTAAFIGNSFGAALARLYAGAHPERVTHLILVDGGQVPRLPKIARQVLGTSLAAPLLEGMRRQTFSAKGIKRAFANPDAVTPQVLSDSEAASHGFVALMRQVASGATPQFRTPRAPTLIVWGEHDRITEMARGQEIAAEIPNSQLAIIKNAGHMPQLEDPLSFVTIVTGFVSGDAT